MKKYIKPTIDSEVFVTNEFISACGDISKFSCLNMNDVYINHQKVNIYVYKDTDKDGVLDESENNENNLYTNWNFQNDCGNSGDAVAGSHNISNITGLTRVIVRFPDSRGDVPAVIHSQSGLSNNPHFVSLKNINHS